MSNRESQFLSPFAPRFPSYPDSAPELPETSVLFDRFYRGYGGRYSIKPTDYELLGMEWFKRRFWDYLRKFRAVEPYKSALDNVYCDFVDSGLLNAAVGESQNIGLVGLFVGALLNLGSFFQVLLSHPKVMTGVGEPAKQDRWFDDLSEWNWSLSVGKALEAFRRSGGRPEFAKGERFFYAGCLTTFAMDFLFFHEIGHWCRGHDKLRKKYMSDVGTAAG